MPSVVPNSISQKIEKLAIMAEPLSNNPYRNLLREKKTSIFMLDIFHKYYTLHPLKTIDIEEWREDVERLSRNEYFVHW